MRDDPGQEFPGSSQGPAGSAGCGGGPKHIAVLNLHLPSQQDKEEIFPPLHCADSFCAAGSSRIARVIFLASSHLKHPLSHTARWVSGYTSREQSEPSCLPETLFKRDFSELLHSDMLEARSAALVITTVLPLPHFSSLGFKALLQAFESCSPEPQRLRLNPACSEMFPLLL